MYEIGRVYIWQNQTRFAINGTECTVLSKPIYFLDDDTGRLEIGQETDTWIDGLQIMAEPGDLRPKSPPSGEQSIRDLFANPVIEKIPEFV